MKQIVRAGKTVTVFDDVEELKWHYHRRLCKDSSDHTAELIIRFCGEYYADVKELNKWIKKSLEPCEVRAT